jgi:uncharacterized membrane protein
MRFARIGTRMGRLKAEGSTASRMNGGGKHPEHVAETVEEIVHLENRDRLYMGLSDKLANKITAFSGSMLYVWLHVAWFAIWIVVNISLFLFAPFDPYPFGLLTMIVSLEAIFLSTFVLITQNRQAIAADRRAKVDLQVNMIAEREITKLIEMVKHLHEHAGIGMPDHDRELEEMQEPTHVTKLADAIDDAEHQIDPEGALGPESAVDTQKRKR